MVLACVQNTVKMVILELEIKVCSQPGANMANIWRLAPSFLETSGRFRRGKTGRVVLDSNKKRLGYDNYLLDLF